MITIITPSVIMIQPRKETDRLQLLLDVTKVIVSTLDLRELLKSIAECVRKLLPHEYTTLGLIDAKTNMLRVHALDFPVGRGFIREDFLAPIEDFPAATAIRNRTPIVFNREEIQRIRSDFAKLLISEKIQTVCCVPLIAHDAVLGTLNAASLRENAFTPDDVNILNEIAGPIAIAVENALSYQRIEELKNKLAEEKLYLEEEIHTDYNFQEIVGSSTVLRQVLKQVETVATSEATVLILGETGTGKELIARAIHNLSNRRDRIFVKLNCSAIPTGLFESELFGHERGAFTGAISRKTGRMELANGGTLFLDEVGDIPLEVQPKLLRALQEREFERLGGTQTFHADVRLIAATNRDLNEMMAEREFRSDLYYRLNVFPIHLPSLRERPEDVPLLVQHFVQKYATDMGKKIERIRPEDLNALKNWRWPGNVRELENFIERAVILSSGSILFVDYSSLESDNSHPKQIQENIEREKILRALRESKGTIGGPNGAAARLGVKRTTLQARMKKLGISRQFE